MKTWRIGQLLLLLVVSVPLIFGLAYFLWSLNPKLAIIVEFASFLTIILAWFNLFDKIVSHA